MLAPVKSPCKHKIVELKFSYLFVSKHFEILILLWEKTHGGERERGDDDANAERPRVDEVAVARIPWAEVGHRQAKPQQGLYSQRLLWHKHTY